MALVPWKATTSLVWSVLLSRVTLVTTTSTADHWSEGASVRMIAVPPVTGVAVKGLSAEDLEPPPQARARASPVRAGTASSERVRIEGRMEVS